VGNEKNANRATLGINMTEKNANRATLGINMTEKNAMIRVLDVAQNYEIGI